GAASQSYRQCKIKRANVTVESLRQGLKEPRARVNSPMLRSSFVNFAVCTRYQSFEIPAEVWFRRKSCEPGEACGGAFVQFMEALHIIERHVKIRLRFKTQ